MQEISTKHSDTWIEEGIIHKKIFRSKLDADDILSEYLAERELSVEDCNVIIDARKGYKLSPEARSYALQVYRQHAAVGIVINSYIIRGIYNYILKSQNIENIRFFNSFRDAMRWLTRSS